VSEARRTGKRFPLTLPITLKTKKSARSENATTRNVSAAGVYIQANSKLEIGATIEFDITLPPEIVGTDKGVDIHCKGRVVRLEASKDGRNGKGKAPSKKGVACVIDHYKFIRKK
jgi:hypothetical protein